MTRLKLTEADFFDAAKALGCPIAAIKAVAEIEAPGSGFTPDGQVRILFERHKFSKATGGKFDRTHPGISNPRLGGYGKESAQHGRLAEAVALDRDAALKSASWGKFQILGANYAPAGFASLQGFINGMHAGEPDQLEAFVNFIRADPKLHKALQTLDWATFARLYNGPAYAQHGYDKRMAAAYALFAKNPDFTRVQSAVTSTETPA